MRKKFEKISNPGVRRLTAEDLSSSSRFRTQQHAKNPALTGWVFVFQGPVYLRIVARGWAVRLRCQQRLKTDTGTAMPAPARPMAWPGCACLVQRATDAPPAIKGFFVCSINAKLPASGLLFREVPVERSSAGSLPDFLASTPTTTLRHEQNFRQSISEGIDRLNAECEKL